MKKTNIFTFSSLSLFYFLALGVLNYASAVDMDELKLKCGFCHGKDGNSLDDKTPNIAGMSVDYLIESMEAYKSNERPAMKLKNMKNVVEKLSDDDISSIAAYFAEQKFKSRQQKFDPVLAKAGKKLHRKYCDRCHTEGGTLADDDAGILAGQPIPYLEFTMDNFVNGKREMSKKMAKKFKSLQKKTGDEGIKQLIHYYASQQ